MIAHRHVSMSIVVLIMVTVGFVIDHGTSMLVSTVVAVDANEVKASRTRHSRRNQSVDKDTSRLVPQENLPQHVNMNAEQGNKSEDEEQLDEEEDLYYEPDGYELPSIEDLLAIGALRAEQHQESLYGEGSRGLTHTIPPLATPRGCKYSYGHNDVTLVYWDKIDCPNGCGTSYNASLLVTTTCTTGKWPKGTCTSKADCRVSGCTDTCTAGVGGCPCPTDVRSTALSALCPLVCPGYPFKTKTPPPTTIRPKTPPPTLKQTSKTVSTPTWKPVATKPVWKAPSKPVWTPPSAPQKQPVWTPPTKTPPTAPKTPTLAMRR